MPPEVNAAAIQSMAISNNDGPTSEMSDEFKKRAKVKLEASSSGDFFKKNDARLLPSFDRGEAERDGKYRLPHAMNLISREGFVQPRPTHISSLTS